MVASASHAVSVQELSFTRGARTILNQLSLYIPQGKITAIMGPSGCGKTTLLRLMAGQLLPDSGTVQTLKASFAHLSDADTQALRRRMGFLFQHGALFTHMTVFDNVAFPLREHTTYTEDEIKAVVLKNLERVGLKEAHQLFAHELSGGMARRVALARAIVLEPELVFYDEPFTGQDPITKGVLLKLIADLNQDLNITTVLVSHDVPETLSIADYGIVLARGEVIAEGTPDVLQATTHPAARQFLDGLPDGPVPYHYAALSSKEAVS